MAINNPEVPNYKKFYIQYGSNQVASDTLATWGFLAKSTPYSALPEPKDPYKNEYLDRDGDDEYVASMSYSSFEFDVQFYIRAIGNDGAVSPAEQVRSKMASFFSAVKEGEFMVYDEYTSLGRRKVRYAGCKDEDFKARKDWARCIFTITFKCNDPVTFMTLSSNKIVSVE